jgi:hypothetical protein
VPLDSPSMGTRSKAVLLAALPWAHEAKKRLSLWFVICLLNLLVVCETNACLNLHSSVTLFMWDLIYVWLKLWWIYVRPYLCETWLIAMLVWKFLEYIMYCYVFYLLNITPNMYCYVYYILQICPTVMCEFICLILLQIYNKQLTTKIVHCAKIRTSDLLPELMTFAWEFLLCTKLRTSAPMLELLIFTFRIRESPKALLVCWLGSISTSTQTNKTLQIFFTPGAKQFLYPWLNTVKWQNQTEGHRRNESSFRGHRGKLKKRPYTEEPFFPGPYR